MRSELSVRNQGIVAGHRDRLVGGKAGHNISLALFHGTFLSPRGEGGLQDGVLCFLLCCAVCLSVCHPNSVILQTHLVHHGWRWETCIRTGLVIALLHCSAAAVGLHQQHGCLIPSRGFLRAQCGKERVNLDLKSLSRDNSNELAVLVPFISSAWPWTTTISHCLRSPGCQPDCPIPHSRCFWCALEPRSSVLCAGPSLYF